MANTAMTRGRRLVALVGQRKALAIAVRNDRAAERFSCFIRQTCQEAKLILAGGSIATKFKRVRFQF